MVIEKRFCGPPDSGNGGYSSGRLAACIDISAAGDISGRPPALAPCAAEVTLRAPPPLDTPLQVLRQNGGAKLVYGEQLIAEAQPAQFALDVPAPPAWAEAQAAGKKYAGHRRHDYGSCFVCGPRRKPGDGLRIFCGPWKNGIVAGTWIPDASLDDGSGLVRPEFLWAAIDCPGSWSVIGVEHPSAPGSSSLLGRLTGRLLQRPRIGEDCICIGWPLSREGRKFHVGSAVFTRSGKLAAYSKGTWIVLKS